MNNDNDNNETQDTGIDTVSDNVQQGSYDCRQLIHRGTPAKITSLATTKKRATRKTLDHRNFKKLQ